MEQLLISVGLSKLQAEAYLYLLAHGSSQPKALMSKLDISRTNTYKVLESLEQLDLVIREENGKKISYRSADPANLSSLIAEKRNTVIALEHNVNQAIQQLRDSYSKQSPDINVSTKTGKSAMVSAYTEQSSQNQPIYFYKTRVDIPFLGFETMDKIRIEQGKSAPKRYGITPDVPEASLAKAIDKKANLTRTWIDEKSYTMPVEWSVAGDELLIQVFDGEGSLVSIKNTLIAEAFKQIWKLNDGALRSSPDYSSRPLNAKRTI